MEILLCQDIMNYFRPGKSAPHGRNSAFPPRHVHFAPRVEHDAATDKNGEFFTLGATNE
jgi:hypothetical protein